MTECFALLIDVSVVVTQQKGKSVGRRRRLTTANVYRTHFSSNKNMFAKAVQMMLTSR